MRRLPVQMRGFVPHDALMAELSSTTALLLPSACYENCPMSLLEAGALGVPTVASDIGGMRELISTGRDGVLIPVGDTKALASAVAELAQRPELVTSLGEAAYQRVTREHSEEAYGTALIEHYERVISRSSPAVRAS